MTNYALLLDLGGAPLVDHVIESIGRFHPVNPTPLSDCGISLADAKAYDADPGCPLRLVELEAPKSDKPTNHNPAVETAKDN